MAACSITSKSISGDSKSNICFPIAKCPELLALIATSILLVISDNFHGRDRVTAGKSFMVGIAQGLAVTPGLFIRI